jgi:hypothetical protein
MTASIMHLTEVVNYLIKWGIMISINRVREAFQGGSTMNAILGSPGYLIYVCNRFLSVVHFILV